jgi:hypothetical protein
MQAAKALWADPVLRPIAAIWLFDDDAHEWRFLIATQDARESGLQAAYLRVRNVLKKHDLLDRLPLRRVVVTDPSNRVVDTLTSLIRTPDEELASAGFYDCRFSDLELSGVHAYLLHGDPASAKSVNLVPAAEHAAN